LTAFMGGLWALLFMGAFFTLINEYMLDVGTCSDTLLKTVLIFFLFFMTYVHTLIQSVLIFSKTVLDVSAVCL
jgi:hypothetical protein